MQVVRSRDQSSIHRDEYKRKAYANLFYCICNSDAKQKMHAWSIIGVRWEMQSNQLFFPVTLNSEDNHHYEHHDMHYQPFSQRYIRP
jgi:hypothetical protein